MAPENPQELSLKSIIIIMFTFFIPPISVHTYHAVFVSRFINFLQCLLCIIDLCMVSLINNNIIIVTKHDMNLYNYASDKKYTLH